VERTQHRCGRPPAALEFLSYSKPRISLQTVRGASLGTPSPKSKKTHSHCAVNRMQCRCLINSLHTLHNRAFALLALIEVSLFLFFSKHHVLPPLYASDFDMVLTLYMPPSKPLDHPAICVISADCPFSRCHLDFALIFWKMKLWQKDLCRLLLCSSFVGMELECKNAISKIKTITQDLSNSSNR
jgi:hypothetical protein